MPSKKDILEKLKRHSSNNNLFYKRIHSVLYFNNDEYVRNDFLKKPEDKNVFRELTKK